MSEITYFTTEGESNTEEAVAIALKAAKELHIGHLVLATTHGKTPRHFLNKKDLNVVAVTHAYGFKAKGENSLSAADRAELQKGGIVVHSAGHVLSGAERGLSSVFKGIFPVEIIAQTLKFFGQGTKVAVEVAAAALDAGLIPFGEPVIAIGGTRGGADTVLVIVPSYSSTILETRIQQILAKPLSPSLPAKA